MRRSREIEILPERELEGLYEEDKDSLRYTSSISGRSVLNFLFLFLTRLLTVMVHVLPPACVVYESSSRHVR